MKTVTAILLTLATAASSYGQSASVHAADYGKVLTPTTDASGHANFGIQYAYDTDQAWVITMTFQLGSGEISKLPPKLYWTLVDAETGAFFKGWSAMSRDDLVVGTFGLSAWSTLKEFLPRMKRSLLVLSVDQKTFLYQVDLGNLCASYPQNIVDPTHPSSAKCVVDPSQFPKNGGRCESAQTQFKELLGKGLVTCAIANNALGKHGCLPLECH